MKKKNIHRYRLIAILRGLEPSQASAVGSAVWNAGIDEIEVPLTSPQALHSIEILRATLPEECVIGAGTVVDKCQVDEAVSAGAKLIVSPHVDPAVIERALAAQVGVCPGVATPSEALMAIRHGATALKLFPALSIGVEGMRAWQPVLPCDIALLPVGGITQNNLAQWLRSGASGAGVGSSLFTDSLSIDDIYGRAKKFVSICRESEKE